MAQFEIDLPSDEVAVFDRTFWRFVYAELSDDCDPDVRLDAYSVGDGERRVVTFGDHYQAAAFQRHWWLVSSTQSPAEVERRIDGGWLSANAKVTDGRARPGSATAAG